jgi:hypothetical protein
MVCVPSNTGSHELTGVVPKWTMIFVPITSKTYTTNPVSAPIHSERPIGPPNKTGRGRPALAAALMRHHPIPKKPAQLQTPAPARRVGSVIRLSTDNETRKESPFLKYNQGTRRIPPANDASRNQPTLRKINPPTESTGYPSRLRWARTQRLQRLEQQTGLSKKDPKPLPHLRVVDKQVGFDLPAEANPHETQ